MTLSYIPQAQRFIGGKIAGAISDKLGTEVCVGRVDLGLFSRIIIDDVKILDQQQKEMLRVGRLSVRLELLPLLDGKISISSAQLFGAHFLLYKQDAESKPNFQFALDSLASKDTTSHTPLDLRINSLIIRPDRPASDQRGIQSAAPQGSGTERTHQPACTYRRLAERKRKATGV